MQSKFGMINVSNNKQCVIMSRSTIAPIKVVPYINGLPDLMRYTVGGNHCQVGSKLLIYKLKIFRDPEMCLKSLAYT